MLTKRGWFALGLTALLYILADVLQLRALYTIFAAMSLCILISYLQVRITPSRLFFSRSIARRTLIEGEEVSAELRVRVGGRISGVPIGIDDYSPPEVEVFGINVSSIVPGGIISSYRIRPTRRGIYELGPSMVKVSDIFGFLEMVHQLGETDIITVYPRYEATNLPGLDTSTGAIGTTTAESKGTSPDFLRIREYQPGDEVKVIHWKSSAKRGKLMVRELEREEARSANIVMDCRQRSYPAGDEAFETAVRIAASLAVSILNEDIEVGLILNDSRRQFVFKDRGPVQYHRILSSLASVSPDGKLPLDRILDNIGDGKRGNGNMIVVTGRASRGDALSLIRGAGTGRSYLVLTSQGQAPSLKSLGREVKIGVPASGGGGILWG